MEEEKEKEKDVETRLSFLRGNFGDILKKPPVADKMSKMSTNSPLEFAKKRKPSCLKEK